MHVTVLNHEHRLVFFGIEGSGFSVAHATGRERVESRRSFPKYVEFDDVCEFIDLCVDGEDDEFEHFAVEHEVGEEEDLDDAADPRNGVRVGRSEHDFFVNPIHRVEHPVRPYETDKDKHALVRALVLRVLSVAEDILREHGKGFQKLGEHPKEDRHSFGARREDGYHGRNQTRGEYKQEAACVLVGLDGGGPAAHGEDDSGRGGDVDDLEGVEVARVGSVGAHGEHVEVAGAENDEVEQLRLEGEPAAVLVLGERENDHQNRCQVQIVAHVPKHVPAVLG